MTAKVLVAVLLAAGCSSTEKTLPADYNAVPVTKQTGYTAPAPRPRTGILGSTALSTIQGRVETILLPQIRKQAAIPVTCDGSAEPDGTQKSLTCHATWEGVRVPFDVTVGGLGSPYYQLEVKQQQALLLADAVRDAWSFENSGNDSPRSCDSNIPKATLVPIDKTTPYRCAIGTSVYTVTISSGDNTSHMWFESAKN